MHKLGIAIDESALTLLRKHAGSPRRVGALISKLIKQYDYDEAYGYTSLQQRLSRIEQYVLELLDGMEAPMQVSSPK